MGVSEIKARSTSSTTLMTYYLYKPKILKNICSKLACWSSHHSGLSNLALSSFVLLSLCVAGDCYAPLLMAIGIQLIPFDSWKHKATSHIPECGLVVQWKCTETLLSTISALPTYASLICLLCIPCTIRIHAPIIGCTKTERPCRLYTFTHSYRIVDFRAQRNNPVDSSYVKIHICDQPIQNATSLSSIAKYSRSTELSKYLSPIKYHVNICVILLIPALVKLKNRT